MSEHPQQTDRVLRDTRSSAPTAPSPAATESATPASAIDTVPFRQLLKKFIVSSSVVVDVDSCLRRDRF